MSLRAVLVGPQLRYFKNGLVCLSKLGSELLLEALPEKIILRTINSSKSAYAAITYYAAFFHNYDLFDTTLIQAGVLMKQLLAVFRTQKIAKLGIEVAADAAKLIATVYSDNGLVKEYRIPCMESEILQASVDRSTLPTCVVAAAKELNRLLASFQTNLDEMTIIAMADSDTAEGISPKSVQLHSFLDPAKAGAEKSLHTQLCIDTLEVFLSYQHASATPSDVTFNLKDFRCLLGLCQEMQADVTIRFDRPGQPLLVEPHFRSAAGQDIDYGAELVLATLLESQAANLAKRGADVAPASTIIRRRPTAPQDGRSPNVPGDTPWGRPGPTTGAPRTTRFAPQTGAHVTDVAEPLASAAHAKPSASRLGVQPESAGPATLHREAEREHSGRGGTETTAQRLADQFADAWARQEQGVAGGEEPGEEVGMEVEDVNGAPLLSGLNDNPQMLDADPRDEPRTPYGAGVPNLAGAEGKDAWEDRGAGVPDLATEEGNDPWGDAAALGKQAHWADASAEDDGVLLGGAAYGAAWGVPLHSRYLGSGAGPDDDGDDEYEEDEDAIPGTPPMR